MPINEHEAKQPMVHIVRVLAGSKASLANIVAAATEFGALQYDYTCAINRWRWKETDIIPPTPESAKAMLEKELERYGIEPDIREEIRMRYDEYLRKFVIKEATIPEHPIKGRTYKLEVDTRLPEITRPLAGSKLFAQGLPHIEDVMAEAASIGEDFAAHRACYEQSKHADHPVSIGPSLDTRFVWLERGMARRGVEPEIQQQVLANYRERWQQAKQALDSPQRPQYGTDFSLS